MYDHFEDIKEVADALTIPVANGEQDQSFVHFRSDFVKKHEPVKM